MTSMVDCDSSARAATVSSYFRALASPNKLASSSSPLSLSSATNCLAAVKSRTLDISRLTPAATVAMAVRISSKMSGGARDNSRDRTASVALRSS